ncbi:MAG: hypothetical protein ABIB71_02340 [Candidatus Woesearchaeota archaeon]
MAIEEKLSKDITWVYAAKQIAPYVEVTYPQIPVMGRIKLGLFHKILRKAFKIRSYMSGEKKQIDKLIEDRIKTEEQYLIKAGMNTLAERDAFTVVHAAASYLQRVIRHAESYKREGFPSLEITKRGIKVNKNDFEDIIELAVSDGIYEIEEQTPFKIGGERMKLKAINPDFKEKAKERLLEEIYSGLDTGAEVNFLERVTVGKDEDAFYMTRYYNNQ